jgi:excisionase family DNA binding protein
MTDSTFDVEAFKREIADEVVARLRAERDERPLLSPKELAARLGISDRTVRSMIESGRMPSLKIGGLTKVEPAEVDAYLDRQKGVGSPVRQAE